MHLLLANLHILNRNIFRPYCFIDSVAFVVIAVRFTGLIQLSQIAGRDEALGYFSSIYGWFFIDADQGESSKFFFLSLEYPIFLTYSFLRTGVYR